MLRTSKSVVLGGVCLVVVVCVTSVVVLITRAANDSSATTAQTAPSRPVNRAAGIWHCNRKPLALLDNSVSDLDLQAAQQLCFQDEQTGREIRVVYDPSANGGQGRYRVFYPTVTGIEHHIDVNMGSTIVLLSGGNITRVGRPAETGTVI